MPEDQRQQIEASIRSKYREVSERPEGRFPYPVGRESMERLGYSADWIEAIPPASASRFVGVGNPFKVARPQAGWRVLDVGCGAGADTFVAALLAGDSGAADGVDLTPEMVRCATAALTGWDGGHARFHEATADALPFPDAEFDLVISNGVLNLVPDKRAALKEIARVLRPGGTFAAADLVVTDEIPPEILADMDAWST